MADETNGSAIRDRDASAAATWLGLLVMVGLAAAILWRLVALWPADDCLARRAACASGSGMPVAAEDAGRKLRDGEQALQAALGVFANAAEAQSRAQAAGGSGGVWQPVDKAATDARDLQVNALADVVRERGKVAELAKARDVALREWAERQTGAGGMSFERQVLYLMFLLGALGGVFHGLYSWVVHAGVGNLKTSWLPWLLVRPGVGGLLALIVYLVLRGGLVSPLPTVGDAGQPFNFYGFAALAALSGLFTHQASEKLKEIFSAVFKPAQLDRVARGPVVRKVVPETVSPAALAAGTAPTLRLEGEGFTDRSVVKVAGVVAEVLYRAASMLEIKLPKLPAPKEGASLDIVIEEPSLKPSDPAKLTVRSPPPPAIAGTTPTAIERALLDGASRLAIPVAVTGTGLAPVTKVMVGATVVPVTDSTDTGFKLTLPANLVTPPTTDTSLALKLQDKDGKDLASHSLPLK